MSSSSVLSLAQWSDRSARRASLRRSTAEAFAPAAITNFFEISYDSSPHATGATGGGYILSRGTRTRASVVSGGGVSTVVNGDPSYNARTTRRAVDLLLSGSQGVAAQGLRLRQAVETPIGSGFGASAASATSAVLAAAAALGLKLPKRKLALFAYQAEIIERTGLGTVSVVYDHFGAGAITRPGEPGVAKFVRVRVPADTRIVTAYLAPFDKKDALTSESISRRVNELGRDALRRFLADPTLDNLAGEGERFSAKLGLESPEVKKLVTIAKASGARYASQNMIGYSIHSVVDADESRKVSKALQAHNRAVRVDTFEVGSVRAGVTRPSRR